MQKKCFGIMGVVIVFILCCFSSIVASAYDQTDKILSKVQGQWYDEKGNVVLDFEGRYLNGCPVVGVYNPTGGGADFTCVFRVIEAGGYRDIYALCLNQQEGNYHSRIILGWDSKVKEKGTLLLKSTHPLYAETVGGIGLDMLDKEVLEKYGKPDTTFPGINRNSNLDHEVWRYEKIGLELVMSYHRVWKIRILKNGDRRFDRTGFNCANAPYEYQGAYGFKRAPQAGPNFGASAVGHGEYMWFRGYPQYIELSTFWN